MKLSGADFVRMLEAQPCTEMEAGVHNPKFPRLKQASAKARCSRRRLRRIGPLFAVRQRFICNFRQVDAENGSRGGTLG